MVSEVQEASFFVVVGICSCRSYRVCLVDGKLEERMQGKRVVTAVAEAEEQSSECMFSFGKFGR